MSHATTYLSLFLSTFVLEDAAIVAGALLINTETIHFNSVFISLFLGISLGDIILYFCGRIQWFRSRMISLVKKKRFDKIKNSLAENAVFALVVARFVPGLRLPCFFLSGLVGISLVKFILIVVLTTALWVYGLLYMLVFLKEIAGPLKTSVQIILGSLACIVWFYFRYAKKKE